MKLIDRPGGVSGMDMVTYKKNQACAKRKAEEAFSVSKRRERESSWQEKMNTSVQVDSSTDDDEEDDQDSGDEYNVDYEPKNKTVTLDISKKALRNAALAAEKNSISNRGAAEFTAALVTGGGTSIDNLPISKSNFNKHKTKAREEKAFDIKESDLEMLRDKDGLWVIHWDGKTLKKLQHSGENSEYVAVVMKALHTDKEILLEVINLKDCDGEGSKREADAIFAKLMDYGVNPKTIVGFVFDTTATNSGLINGVVVRLQALLGDHYLQLACRHHVFELVCGASSSLVYHAEKQNKNNKGKKKGTESPEEPLFKAFAASWKLVDKSNYQTFTPLTREQAQSCELIVAFLLQWLDGDSLRHDYKELVELTVLYLGGVFPAEYNFTFKAPGAFHHARWMSKVLYTLKYALFGHQNCFDINETLLSKIKSLASFLSIYTM
jgi:hypothetical protein